MSCSLCRFSQWYRLASIPVSEPFSSAHTRKNAGWIHGSSWAAFHGARRLSTLPMSNLKVRHPDSPISDQDREFYRLSNASIPHGNPAKQFGALFFSLPDRKPRQFGQPNQAFKRLPILGAGNIMNPAHALTNKNDHGRYRPVPPSVIYFGNKINPTSLVYYRGG